ncbi:Uncharacterised protein [Anaerococcus prevotii]|uniref:Uncharacterized protein n=1 Tax=Anaerococcus prevotii (strain ATCC 9321 / DSM 20548 / JCM 6508 / NCTC 11806 / PC1) TaxID=525919 RepID=C7RI12_ANAPD|nr:hypothetical protein [Anaerococcus prevotii]ACV29758.1 hypothetical protein Apre_1740 [Anaerococcus prevotii DSM 20548]SUU94365.1 Uncharacterised protein [Anaerococcus prevotii]
MNYFSKIKNDKNGRGITPFNVCKLMCVHTCRYSCTAKNAAKHPRFGRKSLSNKNDK